MVQNVANNLISKALKLADSQFLGLPKQKIFKC